MFPLASIQRQLTRVRQLAGTNPFDASRILGEGQVNQFAMAKAVASGDQRLMQKAGLDDEIARLEWLHAAHIDDQHAIRRQVREAERAIELSSRRIGNYRRWLHDDRHRDRVRRAQARRPRAEPGPVRGIVLAFSSACHRRGHGPFRGRAPQRMGRSATNVAFSRLIRGHRNGRRGRGAVLAETEKNTGHGGASHSHGDIGPACLWARQGGLVVMTADT